MTVASTRHPRALAVGLAFAGLATEAISMGWVWSRLASSTVTPAWPLPALYLIEAVVLAAMVLWAVVVPHAGATRFGAWPALGALVVMALLGAMTIGLYMALAFGFLLPAAVLGDDGRSTVFQRSAGFVLGVLLQGGIMFGIIQYLLLRPMSGSFGG